MFNFGNWSGSGVWQATQNIKRQYPWVGSVIQGLDKVYDTDVTDSIATDGKHLFINSDWAKEQNKRGTLEWHLARRALNVIQRHVIRREDRDSEAWQMASDIAANSAMADVFKKLKAPEYETPIIRHKTAEQIYDEFDGQSENMPQPQNGDSPDGDNSFGQGVMDYGEGDQAAQEAGGDQKEQGGDGQPQELSQSDKEREIDKQLAKAGQQAGSEPGADERHLFEKLESIVNWHDELLKYMEFRGGASFSLTPPNRRLSQQGIIANRLNPSGCGNIVVAVDNSGSIDFNLLSRFLSELEVIIENIDYETLRVIGCDTRINFDQTYMRGEVLDTSGMRGGGGTRFDPVFDEVNTGGMKPDLLIYFTDMHGRGPTEEQEYPVLFVTDTSHYVDDNNKLCGGSYRPEWADAIDMMKE